MGRDLVSIFASAALATFNPTLLAAVAVMLLLPHPSRLMLGYLLGAYTTSLAVGLAVVFGLHYDGAVNTSRHMLGPGGDVLIGTALVAVAVALATDRDAPVREWRARRKRRKAEAKPASHDTPWHLRLIRSGSARVTFLVGAALSFPGVTYLNTLDHIVNLNPGVLFSVLLVVFFCVMQQLLIEVPLLGYVTAPNWTPDAVTRARAWLHRRSRPLSIFGLATIGILLLVRGVITFAS
jgi:hypothetical protein